MAYQKPPVCQALPEARNVTSLSRKKAQRGYAAEWDMASRHCIGRRFVVFNE